MAESVSVELSSKCNNFTCGVIGFDAPASQPTKFTSATAKNTHQSSSTLGISTMFPRGVFERTVRTVVDMMTGEYGYKSL